MNAMKTDAQSEELSSRPAVNVPERLMKRAGFLIHKAGQRGLQVFNASLASLGINVKHYGVLSVLVEGPCSQVALADALQVDRTSMVQLLDELEAKNLVKRTVDPHDRRAHLLKVTKQGRKMVESSDDHTKEGDERFLEPLTSAEREQLYVLLLKLL